MVTNAAIATLFAFVMLTLVCMQPSIRSANAQSDNDTVSLSGEDVAKAKEIAIADQRVQSYFSGRPYSLMSYGASTNDNEPNVVRPLLTYNIDNKDQLSVIVDLKTSTVIDIQYYPDFMVKVPSQEPNEPSSPADSPASLIAIAVGIAASAVTISAVLGLRWRARSRNKPSQPL